MTLIEHQTTGPQGPIRYLLTPPSETPPKGLLVVIHGKSRSYERLALAFAKPAQKKGLVVLAPIFDKVSFKNYQLLEGWAGREAASHALQAACEDAVRRSGVALTPVAMVGFSAGAQFTHRYAMMFPERVSSLVVAAAGWYTMPDPLTAFPYGCAPSISAPAGISKLDSFLKLPIRVMVGDRDNQADDQLRSSPALDERQGVNRLERARRWVEAVALTAAQQGITSNVALELLPDTGHSAREAIENGSLVPRSLAFLTRSMNPLSTGQSLS